MSMMSKLKSRSGATKKPHRVGRGESSGWGKTAGRGHKGQKARSSAGIPVGFEGGQMPLHRRSPKWGFTQPNRHRFWTVNLSALAKTFKSGEEVTPEILIERGLVRNLKWPVKILANGELPHALKISAHAFSESAKKKIESAKGSITGLEWKKKSSRKVAA